MEDASYKVEKRFNFSESGYGSVTSETTPVTSSTAPTEQSCKSHPITSIQYSLTEGPPVKNINDTCLDPKQLSHVLSHDACLKELNEELEKISINVKRVERDFSAIKIHAENEVLSQEKLEEIFKIINTYCLEHLMIHECDIDENRFSLADFKFGQFLKGLGGTACIFFLDGKLSLVGHKEGIDDFVENILSSVLKDSIVTESMDLDEEQFVYLNVICKKIKKGSTDFTLEEENGSFCAKLHGLKEDVINTKRDIWRRLEMYKEHIWTKQLSSSEFQLLQEKNVQKHLRSVLKDNNKPCFLIAGDKLHVVSETRITEDFKMKLDKELFIECKTNLSELGKNLFLSDGWANKMSKVLRNNTKKQVVVDLIGNDLVVTCLPEVKGQVDSFIESFLDENTTFKLFEWTCTEETKLFCQQIKQDDILEIAKSLTDKILSMSIRDNGIHVKGTEKGIQECQKQLYMIVNDSKCPKKEFTASSEEIVKHLLNEEGVKNLQKIGKKARCLVTVVRPCEISIKDGSIAEENADVIVNSVHNNTSAAVASSTVAWAIFNKGGNNVLQKNLMEKTNGRLQTGDVAETEAEGDFQCKTVYHACLPENSSNQKEDVQKIVKKCLEKAERDGYKSISFPALGTGVYNYDATSSAEGLFDAIAEFSKSSVLMENVCVVLHEQSRGAVKEAFRQEYKSRLLKESTLVPLVTLKKGCITGGKVTIIGESLQNIENAKKELDAYCNSNRS